MFYSESGSPSLCNVPIASPPGTAKPRLALIRSSGVFIFQPAWKTSKKDLVSSAGWLVAIGHNSHPYSAYILQQSRVKESEQGAYIKLKQ
jgi:hypothetical protein